MAVVARTVDVGIFGVLSVLLALINMAVVFAVLGHDTLATRNIGSIYLHSNEMRQQVFKYIRRIYRDVLIGSLLGMALITVFASARLFEPDTPLALKSLVLLVPAISLIRINEGLTRGAHRPVKALIPDGVVRPACAVVLFLVFILFGGGMWISLSAAMLISTGLAIVVSFLFRYAALASVLDHGRNAESGFVRPSDLISFSPSIYYSSVVAVFSSQLGLVLVGSMTGPAEAAAYSVAQRYAIATALISQGIYQAISSQVAARYSSGELAGLRLLTRRVCRVATGSSLVCALVIASGSSTLLGLFGEEYRDAAPVLYILLLSVMVNVASGPVGVLLLMTGNESKHFNSLVVSVITQAVLLGLLIPRFGALGAAWATLAATLAWNAIMAINVRKALGFRLILFFA